jgi:N-acetylglucosaminyl-diphospho-decaprenol L-rhamnosyltransferase
MIGETGQPEVSIIIVSYNTEDLIGNCIRSVLAEEDCYKEIFVVDNGSSDGSVAYLRKVFPMVFLFTNEENRGFAAANNQVLHQCQGKYIFFLNPDTRLRRGALRAILSYMESNPHVGLAGTKLIDPDGTLQWSKSEQYLGQEYTQDELSGLPGSLACVIGASMVVRADLIKKIGGFDEDFFLYGEDHDICLRVRKYGCQIGYIDEAVVIHFGGQSERDTTPLGVLDKKIRAEHIFYRKHYYPETVKRINREKVLKACWKIIILTLSLPFVKNKSEAKYKLEKYFLVYQHAKNSLRGRDALGTFRV